MVLETLLIIVSFTPCFIYLFFLHFLSNAAFKKMILSIPSYARQVVAGLLPVGRELRKYKSTSTVKTPSPYSDVCAVPICLHQRKD